MESITVKCPCKINLSLEITGLRADGYHTLRSVMQALDFYNIVTVSKNSSKNINISCNQLGVPLDSTNTAYKAAELFINSFNINEGVDITIEKNVPFQAGLGSASADGAGVLFALNNLYKQVGATKQQLINIAEKVGADVPFCLYGGTALAEGIGEALSPLRPLPSCGILIVKPLEGASTKQIFTLYDSLKNPKQPNTKQVLEGIKKADLKEIGNNIANVLELCVARASIQHIKDKLLKTSCLGAAMTGSGTAVYGLYQNIDDTKRASVEFDDKKYFIKAVCPFNGGVEVDM